MASHPKPLDFIIRTEKLKSLNDHLEISFQIDSQFSLEKIFKQFYSKVYVLPDDNQTEFTYEISGIHSNTEIQICEYNDNKLEKTNNYQNNPFIADFIELKVFWESNKYVMKNQGAKVIELCQDQKYLMKIRKRGKKSIKFSLLLILFAFSLRSSKTRFINTNFF
jgi:hypothetical protein